MKGWILLAVLAAIVIAVSVALLIRSQSVEVRQRKWAKAVRDAKWEFFTVGGEDGILHVKVRKVAETRWCYEVLGEELVVRVDSSAPDYTLLMEMAINEAKARASLLNRRE